MADKINSKMGDFCTSFKCFSQLLNPGASQLNSYFLITKYIYSQNLLAH